MQPGIAGERTNNRNVRTYTINYIHNNPVEAGIVEKPEEYLYSSARDYHRTKKCGLPDVIFL